MARVTVEDCVLKVPNRFELVMLAAQRAKEIGAGSEITLERDNDKNTVVSLREIAEDRLDIAALRESLIKNYQKVIEVEDEDEEVIDVMEGENEEWSGISEMAAEGEAMEAGLHSDAMGAADEIVDDNAQEFDKE